MRSIAQITRRSLISVLLLALLGWSALAQDGQVISETVEGESLKNTVTKENPVRNVAVYLPPGYAESGDKRYPVLYLLHGIGDTEKTFTRKWTRYEEGYDSVPSLMDRGIENGKFGEFIVVMPDQRTNWFGSFYVNSSVTGNWVDFTARELVAFIDEKYRTVTDSGHRAIAGHSMGGYGAITIGMKHPEVFGTVYGMNPAIIDWGGDLTIENPAFSFILNAKSFQELIETQDMYKMGLVTVAQAFSPNPDSPPFYCDFPFKSENGRLVPNEPAFTKWAENSPIRMVSKYRQNLFKLEAIKFDSGYEDEFVFIPVNSRRLSRELTNNGVEHIFEEYNGDHRNRLGGRTGRYYADVLPFVWDNIRD